MSERRAGGQRYRGESSGSVGEARSKHLKDHHAALWRANNELNEHEGIHILTTFLLPYPTLEYAKKVQQLKRKMLTQLFRVGLREASKPNPGGTFADQRKVGGTSARASAKAATASQEMQ